MIAIIQIVIIDKSTLIINHDRLTRPETEVNDNPAQLPCSSGPKQVRRTNDDASADRARPTLITSCPVRECVPV